LKSHADRVNDNPFKRLPDASIRTVFEQLSRVDPGIWAMYHRRIKGFPMTFDYRRYMTAHPTKQELSRHRPYLLQPLRDMSVHKVYQKGRQVGVSETSITEVLAFLHSHPKTKIIYTFPRDKQLVDFSTTRITETMAETVRMRRVFGTPNQVYTKRVGDSFLLLRSAWESNLGEGIDADGVVLDEKDRMKEGIDVAFRESLESSPWQLLREVSTPSLPGRGVNATYQVSDQHEWFVKCSKCGAWQPVEFPENVHQEKDYPAGATEYEPATFEYRCRKPRCLGKLDRLVGQWVCKYPMRKAVRGYLMPQTICTWISATELMQKKVNYKFQQLWENYCLGKVSIGESQLLTDLDFERISTNYSLQRGRSRGDWLSISAGIDWGHLNWVVVIGKSAHNNFDYLLGVFVCEDRVRELESVKDIEMYLLPFEPDIIVADAGYGKDRNAYLLRRFGADKFYACNYNPSSKASRTFNPVWSETQNKVLVDRTMTLKGTCRTIKERELGCPFPGSDKYVDLWRKHFLALAPLRQEEDGEIYETIDATGPDHLAHCTAYSLLGLEKTASTGRFNFDFVG